MCGSLLSMPNTLKVVKDEANWRVLYACVWIVDASTHFFLPFSTMFSTSFRDSFFPLSLKCCYSSVQSTVSMPKRLPFLWGFCSLAHWCLSVFSCWCFNGSSVYLPNPFGKHKTNILNVHSAHTHTTWNYCKLQTICRLNQMQFDLTRDFKQSNRDRE